MEKKVKSLKDTLMSL